MARWTRAERLLHGTGGRLLDVGCAFGFATRRLARRFETIGVDVSQRDLRRALRGGSSAAYLCASGSALPFISGSFDALVALDVLEHVPDEAALLEEAARVLRPAGRLVLSVPHRGLLHRFDSYNVCAGLLDRQILAPGRAPGPGPLHRHYSDADLIRLLQPAFSVESVVRTGLGLAEFVNIALLWFCLRLLRWPRLYDWLQYLYFTVYLIEDIVPCGRLSYHIMLSARRQTGIIATRSGTTAGTPAAAIAGQDPP